jgi:plasmid maintenance system antidote protein VapI
MTVVFQRNDAAARRRTIAIPTPTRTPALQGRKEEAVTTALSVAAARSAGIAKALILARVFGNSAEFWLNIQRRTDLWEAMNSPDKRKRIERAKPIGKAA